MIEIDESIFRPQHLSQLLAGDGLPGPLQQNSEDLKGLALQLELKTLLTQLARLQVKLESPETDYPPGLSRFMHQRGAPYQHHFSTQSGAE